MKTLIPKSEILNKFQIPNLKCLEFRISCLEFATEGSF